MANTVKVNGRGRPAIFVGLLALGIVRVIKTHGLMRGQKLLASKALVQPAPGKKRQKVKISLPTLSKLAEKHGVTFQRGRPKVAA